MGAYKRLYLDDANDLMRLVFEETSKDKTHDFSYFVEGFMSCKFRELMDVGSTRIINMTYDELMSYLHKECPELYKRGKFSIDSLQAGWIGEIYNNLQFILKISSKEIYEKFPLDKIMRYFVTLHTVSMEVALDRLIQNEFKFAKESIK